MAWERELDVGRQAARRAGEIALRYAARGVSAETKPDRSPVTVADRECEEAIVSLLLDTFPRDGILGEEGARAEAASGRRWIVDPIDGTRDFLRGLPLWSNLVALEAEGEPVVGICNLAPQGGCQDAILVASGRAEVWIELTAASWDLAPLKVIAEEAGARFFNFDGGSSIHGGNCVICVPALEAEVSAFLDGRPGC